MNKNVKRLFASAAIMGMVSTGAAFAAEEPEVTAVPGGTVTRPSAEPTLPLRLPPDSGQSNA